MNHSFRSHTTLVTLNMFDSLKRSS